MSSGKADMHAITISNGKSPDRAKTKSVYSHGHQSLGASAQVNHAGSHQGSFGLIGQTRSPYLGLAGAVNGTAGGVGPIGKQRLEKTTDGSSRKRDSSSSMLANAIYKNGSVNATVGGMPGHAAKKLASQSNASSQNNVHKRAKSQSKSAIKLQTFFTFFNLLSSL